MGTVCYLSVTVNPAQMEDIWARSAVLFGKQIENKNHYFDTCNFSGLRPYIQSDAFVFYSLIFLDYVGINFLYKTNLKTIFKKYIKLRNSWAPPAAKILAK